MPLLAFSVYVAGGEFGWNAVLAILAALVIANGWVSSHAADPLYSDLLLFLDMTLLALYFLTIDALNRAGADVSSAFWFYSAAVFLIYAAWDLVVRSYSDQAQRRRRYLHYVAILILSAPLLVAVGVAAPAAPGVQAAGIAVWAGVLGLWHFDKWKLARTAATPGGAG